MRRVHSSELLHYARKLTARWAVPAVQQKIGYCFEMNLYAGKEARMRVAPSSKQKTARRRPGLKSRTMDSFAGAAAQFSNLRTMSGCDKPVSTDDLADQRAQSMCYHLRCLRDDLPYDFSCGKQLLHQTAGLSCIKGQAFDLAFGVIRRRQNTVVD